MGSSDGQLRVGVPEEPFGSQGEGAYGAGFRVCVCLCACAHVCVKFAHGCGVLNSFALK